jgi:cobalt/nickel transport system permease protein
MLGAAAASLELALSGTVPLTTVLPAMLGVHALIGVGEAVVTVAAVSAVLSARPDLIAVRDRPFELVRPVRVGEVA